MRIKRWGRWTATDDEDRRYIDLTAGGIFAAMLGPDSRELKRAMAKPGWITSYAGAYDTDWSERYIGMLRELTGFESVAIFSTGSEATEAFWRVCRAWNGKPGVWGGLIDPDEVGTDRPLCDAMHGWTLGALIMAGKVTWPELGIFPELGAGRFGMEHAKTGCMIMEPYHAPSAQFHRIDPTINRIKGLMDEFGDIPLCIDEIQGGFGRTGKLWAHEHYLDQGINLSPQFVTIGKLVGGGFPVSALLGPKEIMEGEVVKEHGHLYSTHAGNPLACSVGCTVIEEMQRQDLIAESARKGAMMHEAMATWPIRVHGKGLLAGLEFRDREECRKAVDLCHAQGLLVVDTGRKWIKIGPALNILDDLLTRGIEILKGVVEEVVHDRVSSPESEVAPVDSDLSVNPEPGLLGSEDGGDKS